MKFSALSLAAALVGVGAISVINDASAATFRIKYWGTSAICEAVDPSNFTGLRYRIYGVYNASPASIQVVCTLPSELVGDLTTGGMELEVTNFRTSPASIQCTAFGGSRESGMSVYPASKEVAANDTTTMPFDNVSKTTSGAYEYYAMACVIPPGFELNLIRHYESDTSDGL